MVSVSGYRVKKLLELAHQRLSTIIIGGGICIIVSIFLCPVWAGEDLHKLVALHLEKLAIFLKGHSKTWDNIARRSTVYIKHIVNSTTIETESEILETFLAGFGGEYFQSVNEDKAVISTSEKTFLLGYKSILTSKNMEESLVRFSLSLSTLPLSLLVPLSISTLRQTCTFWY